MTIPVTVPGVGKGPYSTITLQYNTQQSANFALQLLSTIYAAAAKDKLQVQNDAEKAKGGGKHPTVKEWTIGDSGGKQNTGPTEGTVPAGFLGIIDAYTNQVSEIVGAPGQKNETVVAGGNMHFYTNGGSGTVISGQGNNLVNANASGEGNWTVIFDGGNNTVYANSGNFFIDDGNASTTGANSIFLGSGNDTVLSWGQDSIIGAPGGTALVATFVPGALYWGNSGPSTYINFGGKDTFAGGAGGSDTVFAVNTGGLYFAGGSALEFISNVNTANTVVGGSASNVIWGNAGSNGLYFVGTGSFVAVGQSESQTVVGGSTSHSAELFGLNDADITLFSPVNGNELIAGSGNVTLNGANASGNDAYFAGPGASSADSIIAGSGNNTLVAGPGSNTLTGGSGANVFQVNKGFASGGSDFLMNWNSKDTLLLSGYGAGKHGGLPPGTHHSVVGGSEVLTLSDGTKITFVGVSHVPNSHIIGT
jgi:Ca2+-binding RTX toxin-like protein